MAVSNVKFCSSERIGPTAIVRMNCVLSLVARASVDARFALNVSRTPFLFYLQRSRRGGGAAISRPASRSAAPSYSKPATTPAPASSSVPAPMQGSSGGGMLSGIGSTIAQGMAFGTGSAIAHRAVGAVAGSFGGGSSQAAAAPEVQPQQQQMQGGVCAMDKQMFFDCLQQNKGDQESCRFLYDQLQQCQQNQTQFG